MMWIVYAVILCALVHISWGAANLTFPSSFKFGAGSSAYQIEGGWNADGKGQSVWDRYVHENSGLIKNNATGDVAADSYHLWREDVKAAAKMKLQFYKFSINWPRILPTGFVNEINKPGANYYSDLIDGLLTEGIEPIITLYHWELPVKIQDLGGWTNPLIVKWFGDYARVVYSLYADRVKTWLTINEPICVCDIFYNSGSYAPGIKEPEYAPYLCNKHMMLAHAKAYRIFDQEFRPRFTGRVSIANHGLWIEPASPNYTTLAELGREHMSGRYSHPIFSKQGGWPPSIEKLMSDISLKQGYYESRLPAFTEDEKKFVKGTADFYGMNHYTTYMIRPAEPGEQPGVWFYTGSPELNATLIHPANAYYGSCPVLPAVPEGIRKHMAWLKKQYGDIDILITENGFSTTGHQLNDYDRITFIKDYLEQVLLSIKLDNVSVIGYTAWSLIDSIEWLDGYATKFGLYEVDFDHPNRTRVPRASAEYYACIIENRSLAVPDSCFNEHYAIRRHKRTETQNGGRTSPNTGLLLAIFANVLSTILNIRLF